MEKQKLSQAAPINEPTVKKLAEAYEHLFVDFSPYVEAETEAARAQQRAQFVDFLRGEDRPCPDW